MRDLVCFTILSHPLVSWHASEKNAQTRDFPPFSFSHAIEQKGSTASERQAPQLTGCVDMVHRAQGPNVAATITAHHLLYNRNALFEGGLRPHMYV